MRTAAASISALAALAAAGLSQAHHSGSIYRTTPVWLSGTVIAFEAVNPHTITTIEVGDEDGRVRSWAVEGPGNAQLTGAGLRDAVPEVGDEIGFCAFPYKPEQELARLFPGIDFSKRRFAAPGDESGTELVAGHLMVSADGEMQLWEPHGLISECIRSSDDTRQSWLQFLDSNLRARRAWCEQRRYSLVESTPALLALIVEIDRQRETGC